MAHHHDCECGHDHHHEHEHESNSVQIDRYHEAFNKFEPALPDTQTTEAVNALLEKHFQENFTPEVLKTIHGCIDLTSLTSLDTKESIWKMVDTVNDFEGTRPDVPNVAAICVYPLFVERLSRHLLHKRLRSRRLPEVFHPHRHLRKSRSPKRPWPSCKEPMKSTLS